MQIELKIIALFFLVGSFCMLADQPKIFNESELISETQIFEIRTYAKIDSLSFEIYVEDNDTVEVTILKDKNCFNELYDPQLAYKDTLIIKEKGFITKKLDLTNLNIYSNREELHFRFTSLNSNSNLITNSSQINQKCDSIIIDRKQYFETHDNIVYGRSNYKVELFYTKENTWDGIYYIQSEKYIDTSLVVSNDANMISIDLNLDTYPDLIIDGTIYLNNKSGNLKEEVTLWEEKAALYYAYDLNNDGNVEVIRVGDDNEIEIKSINGELEIINEKKVSIEGVRTDEIKEIRFFDYNGDANTDIVLNTNSSLQILINNYPNLYLKEINLDKHKVNIRHDFINNKLLVFSEKIKQKARTGSSIEYKAFEYGLLSNGNSEFLFKNNQGSENDKFIGKNEIDITEKLNRRILTPEKYYITDLESDGKKEFIISTECECEPNYIFRFDDSEIQDITEKTDLKFLDLSNSLFVDLNKDGFKEIISIENEKIKVYSQENITKKKSKTFSTKSPQIYYSNKSTQKSEFKSSIKHFGRNQIYGLVDFTDKDVDDKDTILIDGIPHKFENSNFNILNNLELSKVELIAAPNPFTNEISFVSKNKTIETIRIFDQNGKLILDKEKLGNTYNWFGESNRNIEVPQGVYYYEIKLKDILNPEKGRIIKVEE